MDPKRASGTTVPHINHRRGDTRQRSKRICAGHMSFYGHWNRQASRHLRAAVHQCLSVLRARGYDRVLCEETVFPLADEADNEWNYD